MRLQVKRHSLLTLAHVLHPGSEIIIVGTHVMGGVGM